MYSQILRASVVLALIALGGCAEPLSIHRSAGPLNLVIPDGSTLTGHDATSSSSTVPSPAPEVDSLTALAARFGVSSELLVPGAGATALIRSHDATASFGPSGATLLASADYFGNRAEQTLSLQLTRGASPLMSVTKAFPRSQSITGWYLARDQVAVSVFENCGQQVSGSATHRAWNVDPTTSRSSATGIESSYAQSSAQPDCPPVRGEIEEWTNGGGGGDERLQEDEWYICTYEVWYNRYGEELSRRLIGCRPV